MNENSPLELPEVESDILVDDGKILILHNDDYNTFDHVIKCLVEICDHSGIQAEQCAYIVHYNGKCDVMHGEMSKLEMCCRLLRLKGLSATVE
ncbi:ATP-dependent Clp protease adaptor ClpS [bacterium SCSIO 12643]|nr:ATP-dependent Clp protease adaptor ClpS [bacterium SCSIO 12643]